jgi:hypothetical protein
MIQSWNCILILLNRAGMSHRPTIPSFRRSTSLKFPEEENFASDSQYPRHRHAGEFFDVAHIIDGHFPGVDCPSGAPASTGCPLRGIKQAERSKIGQKFEHSASFPCVFVAITITAFSPR